MMTFGKSSADYLGQIKNNAEEKVEVIEKSLEECSLPKDGNGKIRIVELGTGGGESLKKLRDTANGIEEVEIIAMDIIPGLVAALRRDVGTEGVAADAGHLPFAESTLSGVNLSAVLHEVSSYGVPEDGETVYGKEAVEQVLAELNRVLLPDGIVAYRDVSAPETDLQEPKTVEYRRESWRLFAEWFLADFITAQPQFYRAEDIVMERTESGFSLRAPVGLQRELQRHYLMLRDYLRNARKGEFGLTMLQSPWLDETAGLKRIDFYVAEHFADAKGLEAFKVREADGRRIYTGDSDQFDAFYDSLIERCFENMSSGGAETNGFREMIDEWKHREGLEHYLYGNNADVLELSVRAASASRSKYVLMPESPKEVVVMPRYYYNRYLAQVADRPERDGKQIMALKKMLKADASRSLEVLRKAGIVRGARFDTIKNLL